MASADHLRRKEREMVTAADTLPVIRSMLARSNRLTCAQCGTSFVYDGKPAKGQAPPTHCPRLLCRAKATWTAAEWAARARHAHDRAAWDDPALPLSDVDAECLRRHPARPPAPWSASPGASASP